MNKVYRQSNQENLEQAFTVAERDLGVTRLLDPEGEPHRHYHHHLHHYPSTQYNPNDLSLKGGILSEVAYI